MSGWTWACGLAIAEDDRALGHGATTSSGRSRPRRRGRRRRLRRRRPGPARARPVGGVSSARAFFDGVRSAAARVRDALAVGDDEVLTRPRAGSGATRPRPPRRRRSRPRSTRGLRRVSRPRVVRGRQGATAVPCWSSWKTGMSSAPSRRPRSRSSVVPRCPRG